MARLFMNNSNESPFPKETLPSMLGSTVVGLPAPAVPDILLTRFKIMDFPPEIPVQTSATNLRAAVSDPDYGINAIDGFGIDFLQYNDGWIAYTKDFFCGPYKNKNRAHNVAAHVAFAVLKGVHLANKRPQFPTLDHAYDMYSVTHWFHRRFFKTQSEVTPTNIYTFAFAKLLKGKVQSHIEQLPAETAENLSNALRFS